jgi:hypothetical protein
MALAKGGTGDRASRPPLARRSPVGNACCSLIGGPKLSMLISAPSQAQDLGPLQGKVIRRAISPLTIRSIHSRRTHRANPTGPFFQPRRWHVAPVILAPIEDAPRMGMVKGRIAIVCDTLRLSHGDVDPSVRRTCAGDWRPSRWPSRRRRARDGRGEPADSLKGRGWRACNARYVAASFRRADSAVRVSTSTAPARFPAL